jgi:hypothetical protein
MTDFARNLPALLTRTGIGEEIYAVAADLYPICRSITGNGVRETLGRLSALAPLEISEVPNGTSAKPGSRIRRAARSSIWPRTACMS